MLISHEDKKQTDAIKSELTCPHDFGCEESGSQVCKQVQVMDGLLDCQGAEARDCEFSIPIGSAYFCNCPLNRCIHGLSPEPAL
jgi:hypothetical protein